MTPTPAPDEAPQLHNGDRMSREEFHRIYAQMPDSFRAELVGGVVYVASPLRRRHGTHHGSLAEFGGQTVVTPDDDIAGDPELLAEIALSTRSIDLHAKYEDYRQSGVREYLVVCLSNRQFRAFDLVADADLPTDADGVYRSRVFPGLWIDATALFARSFACRRRWSRVWPPRNMRSS